MLEIVIGLLGGILIGATGAGAGLLISPLLILIGYRPAVAVGTGLGVLVASKLVGSVAHYRLGHWPGRSAWQLLAGGAGGVLLTWMFARFFFPHSSSEMDFWVRRSIACALLALPAIFFISTRKRPESQGESRTPREPQWPAHKIAADSGAPPAALFAVGMAIGAPVLMTSLGSGSILGPALLLVTDWEVPQLAAVSNWFGLVVGVLSVAAHVQMGNLQIGSFGKLGLGILPGVALGAWLSRKIPRASFVYGMSAAALILGIRLLLA